MQLAGAFLELSRCSLLLLLLYGTAIQQECTWHLSHGAALLKTFYMFGPINLHACPRDMLLMLKPRVAGAHAIVRCVCRAAMIRGEFLLK